MKILFAGDISTHHSKETKGKAAEAAFAELLPILKSADYRLVNQENVLCPEGVGYAIAKSGPNLRGDEENIDLLKAGGFDCAILANNHFGDFHHAASLATIALLEREGFAHIGGGKDIDAAYEAVIFEKDGVRTSFIAVCENEFGGATKTGAGAAVFNLRKLADRIAEEKQRADFVVVAFHGGNEYNPLPAPRARDRYRLILDLGADALIGGHTHCMQGYEFYHGKPIVYSLGNFFFPWPNTKQASGWNYGYMAELTLEKGKQAGLALHPYRLEVDKNVLHLYTGEEKKTVLDYIERISALIGDDDELAKYFDAWCLGSGVNYAKNLMGYTPDFEKSGHDYETLQKISPVRNLFTCESHNFLIENLLRMEHENRFDEAKAYTDKLAALQKMPLTEVTEGGVYSQIL
ncbi:MAG: CapA family protein [Clostridia bacterium]|nr:CapA family protein [Clostridia bacterium]